MEILFYRINVAFPCLVFALQFFYRSFIVIATSKKITTSKYINRRFSRVPNLCQKVGKTLVVTTNDERIIKGALKITRRPPLVVNVVHGAFVVYEGNIQV